MQWVNFLHIYQPASQADDILETVVNQSYRRVFRGLREIPTARVTLNISGALSELLMKKGYQDVIDDIRWLADNGKLEFTETAKHHPFLPFLPEDEIKRQIELNHKTNSTIFGVAYKPVAFFPPEMAYSERIGKIVAKMGYKIILLDEIAYSGKIEKAPHDHTCIIKNAEPLVALRGGHGEVVQRGLDGHHVLVASEELQLLGRGDVQHMHRPPGLGGEPHDALGGAQRGVVRAPRVRRPPLEHAAGERRAAGGRDVPGPARHPRRRARPAPRRHRQGAR